MSFHQARFLVALELGQVEVRAGAAREQLLGVVEHEEREIEDAALHALAVDRHVLLVEMQAARAHLQHRDLVVQLVALGAGRARLLERQGAADRLADVDLALDLVRPQRRVRVLEVGHVRIGAGIEGVDDHLGIDRAGDLDATQLERLRHRRDLPVAVADRLRLGREVGPFAGVELLRAFGAHREQFLAARLERALQLGDEIERGRREDGVEAGEDGRVDGHALRQGERRHGWFRQAGMEVAKVSDRTSASVVPTCVGDVPRSSSGRPKRLIQSVV